MMLAPHEFICRFLLHSLPDGFHRIRHYGFLANGQRQAKLALIRRLLNQLVSPPPACCDGDYRTRLLHLTGFDPGCCPGCGGSMRVIRALPRVAAEISVRCRPVLTEPP